MTDVVSSAGGGGLCSAAKQDGGGKAPCLFAPAFAGEIVTQKS